LHTLAACLALVVASGCRRPTDPDPLVGTWLATTFEVAPTGQPPVNMLAAGATLGLNVANNFVVAGTLIVPATVTGSTTFTADMAGTATRTDNTVRFSQNADSFVRDLTFLLVENRLEARSQVLGGNTYTVILTRQ
jgi:hypothetical protein